MADREKTGRIVGTVAAVGVVIQRPGHNLNGHATSRAI